MTSFACSALLLSTWLVGLPQAPVDNPVGQPRIKIEFRRAETAPGEGLTEMTEPGSDKKVYLHKTAELTNQDISEARKGKNPDGKPVVGLRFSTEGGKKMEELTTRQFKKPIAILIDGKLICAPIVYSKITELAVIDGRFTDAECDKLVKDLNRK